MSGIDMNSKRVWILGGAFIGMVILLGIFGVVFGNTPVAILNIDGGIVEYLTDGGWEHAIDGMELGPKDTIRTQNGRATLFIYETIIVNLEPDTEVSIAELSNNRVKLQQTRGSTWNKFLSLAGLVSYEIETPNTRATVRGTEFGIIIDEAGDSVLVAEGEVVFAATGRDGNRYTAVQGDMLTRHADTVKIERTEMPESKRDWLVKNVVKTIENLQDIRAMQIKRNPRLQSKLETSQGSQMEAQLDRLMAMDSQEIAMVAESDDRGLAKLRDLQDTTGVEVVDEINAQIKKQIALVEALAEDEHMRTSVRNVLRTKEVRTIIEPLLDARDELTEVLSERISASEPLAEMESPRMSGLRSLIKSIDAEQVLSVEIGEPQEGGATLSVTTEGTLVAAYDPEEVIEQSYSTRIILVDEEDEYVEDRITLVDEKQVAEVVSEPTVDERTRITLYDEPESRITLYDNEPK